MTSISEKVHVVAEIQAKDGRLDEVREDFNRSADESLKAQGCLTYKLFEDAHKAGHFFALGTWVSETALHKHLEANSANLQRSAKSLQGEMKLTILKDVGNGTTAGQE